MNKPATFLLLSLLALLSTAAPDARAATRKAEAPRHLTDTQHDLTIFFSNDVRGETEPCG